MELWNPGTLWEPRNTWVTLGKGEPWGTLVHKIPADLLVHRILKASTS